MWCVFGCPVVGKPWKLLLLSSAAAVTAWPYGYAAAALIGVPVVSFAHELGHCRSAIKEGHAAVIRVSGWLPEVRVDGPISRRTAAAGAVGALAAGAGAVFVLALGAALGGTLESAFGWAGAAGAWGNLAGDTTIGMAAISAADAVVNLSTSLVAAVAVTAVAAAAGAWMLAAPGLAAVGLLAATGVRVFDGDRIWPGLLARRRRKRGQQDA